MPTTDAPRRWTLTRSALAALAITALAAAAADAWFSAFSTFVGYDDEGYFLMTTRFFLEGAPLYDDVPAFYGPAYYALRGLLHGPLRLPNTNAFARGLLIVLWLATALEAGAFVFRETRRGCLAIAAGLLVFAYLRTGLSNPGHPEMLVAAWLAALPLVAGSGGPVSTRRAVILGALVAVVTLTKINAGVLAALAVAAALTLGTPAAIPLAVAILLLPPILMRASPGRHDLLTYTALVSGSFAMAWLTAARTVVPPVRRWGALIAWVGGGLFCTLSLLGWLLASGSSLTGLIHSTVIVPQRLSGVFHSWPPWLPVPPYVFGLPLAAVVLIAGRRRVRPGPLVLIASRLALFALVIAQERFWTRFFPGRNINLVFNLAPYLAWVVLVPPGETAGVGPSLGRVVLVFLACLQLLLAYPIPGSQVQFASVWLVPLGLIALGDAVEALDSFPALPRRRQAVTAAMILLVLWLVAREVRQARAVWIGYHAADRRLLGLPGTGPLRLPEARVATYRWLATNLRASADRMLSTVGSPSLHAWSGVGPPSHLVIPNSLRVLDPAQARDLLAAIDRFPDFVLLRRQHSFLSPRLDDTPGSLPILDELDHRFRTLASLDGWDFQTRRDRPAVTLLDGVVHDSAGRYRVHAAPRAVAGIASVRLIDAETGRVLGLANVRDSATGGPPRFAPDGPRTWEIQLDAPTDAAVRQATYPALRVEAADGAWIATLPFLGPGESGPDGL